MAVAPYATPFERIWSTAFRLFCALVLLFLIAPILVIMPLSFNAEAFFTYPMPGLSLRWYRDFFTSDQWLSALRNSIVIAVFTTVLATILGTMAALGLSRPKFPLRSLVMALLISPMVVPIVITAVGMYFFYVDLGLANTFLGLILADTALGTPFVVITVCATLSRFDQTLVRAGASLGAAPALVFRKIVLPLILPGVISGALFAFAVSFDEVVVVQFLAGPDQRTLPKQMFSGIRETINPTITAAATMLITLSVVLLATVELLRRRSERLARSNPHHR